MARRKDSLSDIVLDILWRLGIFYIIYILLLWFTDRANFWHWVTYGAAVVIIIFVGITFWKKAKFKKGKRWRSDRELLHWLRGMNFLEFEQYIADLFLRLGYKTKVTGGPRDGGIDVIAEKDGIKHYIQCKKYITSKVGVGALRDFYGAIADHLADGKGYFITTNKFTLEAKQFAEDKPIELIDSFRLIKYIHLAEKKQ
ncbi:MAG: restriction endonuclease [Candidatus Nealsonbacteria bacterium]